ncbi:hypothetical protein [Sphingobium nicotianae]|uniref:Uncharacterized protein n=1 Tax=Sphingobium nicotianae TaxID=2782607 RepID=A0A9X1IR86_9SPHN|nr:hypothetical protein [Sphingobium nicotianae]MBT2187020.1 hypothetical protein [Sphingobium nicotianae]
MVQNGPTSDGFEGGKREDRFPDQSSGYLAGLAAIPIFFFFAALWGNEKGAVAADVFASLLLLARAKWSLSAHGFFWVIILALFVADLSLLYFMRLRSDAEILLGAAGLILQFSVAYLILPKVLN